LDARNIGLRNIEVADTKICSIDEEKCKLIYRGYDILDSATILHLKKPVIFIIWRLPDKPIEEFHID
jgi:citrate synthase